MRRPNRDSLQGKVKTTLYDARGHKKAMKSLAILTVFLLIPVAGCITEVEDADSQVEAETPSLDRMNIVAQTLDRDVDQYSEYNVLENSSGQNTLILWAASGCRGCHEWTEMIRESIANGSISNESNIITIQRYPSFDSRESFYEVFGNNSSDQYSPWPVLVPYSSAVAWNAETGEPSTVPLDEAFGNPRTPTLQVLGPNGEIVWENEKYYPDFEVVEEISSII
ncbi:MAG: hypothetical protein CMA62_00925 [Euryarchaeota archaeon]|nr:hypothetical protein [Euryarchaeota archaeon]|tara:strand:+ start:473 stop:1144 length:672 start_codon:yes stop_codon:yes gene_type:complete